MTLHVRLRAVADADLPIFFEQQLDPVAVQMAAFTAKNPADRDAFNAHWMKIRRDPAVMLRTVLADGRVAGYVGSFEERPGKPEVTYWIAKEFWGQGIGTEALSQFLRVQERRPIYARAARDNVASLRVLEKCGFSVTGFEKGYANARGEEIEEANLKLESAERKG